MNLGNPSKQITPAYYPPDWPSSTPILTPSLTMSDPAATFSSSVYAMLRPWPSGNVQRTTSPPKPSNPDYQSGFAPSSVGSTYYIYRKPSKPTSSTVIVLVHGFSYNDVWLPIADQFYNDGRIVLSFDNYGRGFSSAPDREHYGSLYVQQIVELLYYLGISEPIDLAGMSQGGAIATLFASIYPQKIKHLALVAAAGLPIANLQPAVQKMIVETPILGEHVFARIFPSTALKRFSAQWQDSSTEYYHSAYKNVESSMKEHPGYLRSLYSTLKNFPMGGLKATIEAVGQNWTNKNNAIALLGTDDKLIPYQNKSLLQRLWPSLKIIDVEKGEHMFCIERWEETYKPLKQLFEQ